MYSAHGRHDDPPKNHDYGKEKGRSEALKQNLSQRLESGIRDEKDGQRQVVLSTRQLQIFAEASDFGIADVGTVEKRGEVQQTEPWDQLEIEFPQEYAVLE